MNMSNEYQDQVASVWFTSPQLKRAGLEGCEDVIDYASGKRANGAYGMNVIEKAAGADQDERRAVAEKLWAVMR